MKKLNFTVCKIVFKAKRFDSWGSAPRVKGKKPIYIKLFRKVFD